ncbi:hypothetical protein RISK_005272 [Rhodopirellula islandica]|uniref:Uncharacterized protein n=1 Tax=Rhodopirellula islandica TaxID=595434 RepID=A0A0J1B6U7_RHOIS|nr:hypothetical protein RISK_005272 [Rhodopirellula islandica]
MLSFLAKNDRVIASAFIAAALNVFPVMDAFVCKGTQYLDPPLGRLQAAIEVIDVDRDFMV